ncbi:hypothetical protein PoB_001518500, partial [Plakobranchus ocellatus]
SRCKRIKNPQQRKASVRKRDREQEDSKLYIDRKGRTILARKLDMEKGCQETYTKTTSNFSNISDKEEGDSNSTVESQITQPINESTILDDSIQAPTLYTAEAAVNKLQKKRGNIFSGESHCLHY